MTPNLDTEFPSSAKAFIRHFKVTSPSFVSRTAIATVWKVTRNDGYPAALKIYHEANMQDERHGFSLLEAWQGQGAAKLYGVTEGAALIEWLDGHSLGDLVRNGSDQKATKRLAQVSVALHQQHISLPHRLPTLRERYSALFNFDVPESWPDEGRENILKSKELAIDLIDTQQDKVLLHGDLHHDNVLLGNRGYCAFDAKGLYGERTFELANAFRNPKGVPELLRKTGRISHMATVFSQEFAVNRSRRYQSHGDRKTKQLWIQSWTCWHVCFALQTMYLLTNNNKAIAIIALLAIIDCLAS